MAMALGIHDVEVEGGQLRPLIGRQVHPLQHPVHAGVAGHALIELGPVGRPNAADLGKIRTQLSSLMDVAETAGRLREALGFAEQYIQYLPAQDSERVAVQYRMARIYRKQGNMDAWKTTLTDIAAKNPGTVYGQLANSELKAAEIAQDAARYSPTGRI